MTFKKLTTAVDAEPTGRVPVVYSHRDGDSDTGEARRMGDGDLSYIAIEWASAPGYLLRATGQVGTLTGVELARTCQ